MDSRSDDVLSQALPILDFLREKGVEVNGEDANYGWSLCVAAMFLDPDMTFPDFLPHWLNMVKGLRLSNGADINSLNNTQEIQQLYAEVRGK